MRQRVLRLLSENQAAAALEILERDEDRTPESSLLAAVIAYREGFIPHAMVHLRRAIEAQLRWEEDDALDRTIQPLLGGEEYLDFEQLYLDELERFEGSRDAHNRWFHLNMPVYELLTAAGSEQGRARAQSLLNLLAPERAEKLLGHGEKELERIIRDFSRSEVDARFGLEALKLLRQKQYPGLAGLVLALLLENLKEFGPFFALSADQIKDSNLQQLVVLLPLRIAIDLLLLYSLSEPKVKMGEALSLDWETRPFLGLMAAAFVNFYQQVHEFRKSAKAPPSETLE